MKSNRSIFAKGVLCIVSVLIIGSCLGCGIASFCSCDDDRVDAYYDGLAPDASQGRMDVQIQEESIEEHIDIRLRDSAPDLADIDSTGGQGVLWATHFATVI